MIMTKISIDTVRRANQRAIMLMRDKTWPRTGTSGATFDVSVSVMGKVFTQSITTDQIKNAYSKAIGL